nr:MAG TPA: Herpesvirus glycoprotein H C-terminal domain [Caudoviricetes sp.]
MQDKVKSSVLLRYGEIVKMNTFETIRGVYTIRIIKYKNQLFFHKMKNGSVVEIKNLSKGEIKDNG